MATKSFTPTQLSIRAIMEQKYEYSRKILLAVIVCTIINVTIAFFSGELYLLFTATIPYVIVVLAMLFCGLYPPEYYGDIAIMHWPREVIFVAAAVAVLIIGLYILAYVMSKNNRGGWMTLALILFSIDTFVCLGYTISVLDLLFHGIVLFELFRGVKAYKTLKMLPEIDIATARCEYNYAESTVPLRIADMTKKSRIFLNMTSGGKHIIYRRVGRTNELVVNGYVYDEYTALFERPHSLTAVFNDCVIEAGTHSVNRTFISVNGVIVSTSFRFY